MPYTVMLVDNEAIIPRGLMCLIDWKAHNCCVRAIANDGVDASIKFRSPHRTF